MQCKQTYQQKIVYKHNKTVLEWGVVLKNSQRRRKTQAPLEHFRLLWGLPPAIVGVGEGVVWCGGGLEEQNGKRALMFVFVLLLVAVEVAAIKW